MSGPSVTTVNAPTGSNPGPTWRIGQLAKATGVMSAMHRPLTYEELDRMVAERRRIAEGLTPAQRAELAEARQRWADQLSPVQLGELHRVRHALVPAGWPAVGRRRK